MLRPDTGGRNNVTLRLRTGKRVKGNVGGVGGPTRREPSRPKQNSRSVTVPQPTPTATELP